MRKLSNDEQIMQPNLIANGEICIQYWKILQRIAKQKRKFGCSIGKYCNRGPLGEGCSRESRGIMHIGSLHNLLYKLIMLIFLCRDTLILHRRSSNLKNCKYQAVRISMSKQFLSKIKSFDSNLYNIIDKCIWFSNSEFFLESLDFRASSFLIVVSFHHQLLIRNYTCRTLLSDLKQLQ